MNDIRDLTRIYGPQQRFVEVKDLEDARKQLNSKASCCWGAGENLGEGFIKLCDPSPNPRQKKIVFVCRKELFDQISNEENKT
jgi:hypothetical protein